MKRFISYLLVAIMMVTAMVPVAYAAGTELIVSSVEGIKKADDIITVTVSINGNTGFTAYGMTLNYNKDAFELLKVSNEGSIAEIGAFVANNPEEGFYTDVVTFGGISAVKNDGMLFTATFKVKATANNGEHEITVDLDAIGMSDTDNMVVGTINDGKVTVEQPCNHVYAEAFTPIDGTYHGQKCTVCGKVWQNKAAHTWEWVIDTEATGNVAGTKHEECSVCHYKKESVKIPSVAEVLQAIVWGVATEDEVYDVVTAGNYIRAIAEKVLADAGFENVEELFAVSISSDFKAAENGVPGYFKF